MSTKAKKDSKRKSLSKKTKPKIEDEDTIQISESVKYSDKNQRMLKAMFNILNTIVEKELIDISSRQENESSENLNMLKSERIQIIEKSKQKIENIYLLYNKIHQQLINSN